jgi:hypothetical protein
MSFFLKQVPTFLKNVINCAWRKIKKKKKTVHGEHIFDSKHSKFCVGCYSILAEFDARSQFSLAVVHLPCRHVPSFAKKMF